MASRVSQSLACRRAGLFRPVSRRPHRPDGACCTAQSGAAGYHQFSLSASRWPLRLRCLTQTHPNTSREAARAVATLREGHYHKGRLIHALSWIARHPQRSFELTAARIRAFWFPSEAYRSRRDSAGLRRSVPSRDEPLVSAAHRLALSVSLAVLCGLYGTPSKGTRDVDDRPVGRVRCCPAHLCLSTTTRGPESLKFMTCAIGYSEPADAARRAAEIRLHPRFAGVDQLGGEVRGIVSPRRSSRTLTPPLSA